MSPLVVLNVLCSSYYLSACRVNWLIFLDTAARYQSRHVSVIASQACVCVSLCACSRICVSLPRMWFVVLTPAPHICCRTEHCHPAVYPRVKVRGCVCVFVYEWEWSYAYLRFTVSFCKWSTITGTFHSAKSLNIKKKTYTHASIFMASQETVDLSGQSLIDLNFWQSPQVDKRDRWVNRSQCKAVQSLTNMTCTRSWKRCELKHTRSPFRLLIALTWIPFPVLLKLIIIKKNLCVCVAGGEGDSSNNWRPVDEERHASCVH